MDNPLKLTALLVLLCTALFSQTTVQLSGADDFYQQKSQLYQYWMDNNGLGGALSVNKYELKKNGHELELFLTLRTTDPDTAAAMWTNLVRAFEDVNNNKKLTDELFWTFTRMMEILPKQGNVQVYIPRADGPGFNPCFYVWVWEEEGRIAEESQINNCKAQPLNVMVQPVTISTVANVASVEVDDEEEARVVFDRIMTYAKERYEPIKHYERYPRVEEEERTDYMLKFTVSDLSKEVLHQEDLSPWCKFYRMIGGDCNDMRRERLEFTIHYTPGREGYRLTGTLTGKFGIGPFVPRTTAYMDMDPDFEEDFLKPYARRFQKELKAYLERG